MKKVLLTQEALVKLKQEYEDLIVKRTVISEEIKKARSFGDLSENAEYHAAREAQSLNETEILKLKDLLENYEIVNTDSAVEGSITLNSNVKFKFVGDDEIEEVQVVTKIESNPIENLISNESPVGEALLGHFEGDIVNCLTPNGIVQLEIISVNYN